MLADSYDYFFVLDSNCIQVLAPDDSEGTNWGKYEPGEHIGNLRKEYAARLAPIIDALIDTDELDSITFDCCLRDGDTTHDRNGYYLHVLVMSSNTSEFNLKLSSLFRESQLES